MKETKVYLNTIEDLTKALSEGKIVYDDNIGHKCCTRRHKMINGIVIEEYEEESGNYTYINDAIRFDEKRFYILKKEPLKIEVGKFYKTRNGDKVFCYNCCIESRAYDMVVMNRIDYFYSVLKDGRLFNDDTKRNKDIVDYWED